MPPKKELCRNFQRGSCRYGDRCKFLHATSQDSKANPFGFGMQTSNPFQWSNQQPQTSNPFGFGVQNNAQSRGSNEFGSKPNQFKPFENKWTRFNNSNVFASRQSENNPQAADHKCTDPESCKRVIVEDFEKEKPLWTLTCYGHNKYGPCDVVGDISCEELRALAYDDAKSGQSLQFIIERERSLLASKLAEFQNLLQKPYVTSPIATPGTQTPFGGGTSNASNINNGIPTTVSSFTQLNASLKTSSAAAPNYSFGQSSTFQNNNNSNQQSTTFLMNNSPVSGLGGFGGQPRQQSVQSPFSFGSATPSNRTTSAQHNLFSTSANSSQPVNMFGKAFGGPATGANSASVTFGHPSISVPSINNKPNENANVDAEIWTKAEWKWNAGEIPEDPPPDVYLDIPGVPPPDVYLQIPKNAPPVQ